MNRYREIPVNQEALFAVMFLVSLSLPMKAQVLPLIQASGQASVFVMADQVKIYATATAQGVTAQDAAARNATQVAAVLAALNKVLGPGSDIKTISYSVGPIYASSTGTTPPAVVGYSASSTLEVTLNAISWAGTVIDAAIGAGATNVGGLQFKLQNRDPAYQQALRAATMQAKAHADSMASALGKIAGAILRLQEGGAASVPLLVGAFVSPATPTTVVPGLIEVQATVTLEAALN